MVVCWRHSHSVVCCPASERAIPLLILFFSHPPDPISLDCDSSFFFFLCGKVVCPIHHRLVSSLSPLLHTSVIFPLSLFPISTKANLLSFLSSKSVPFLTPLLFPALDRLLLPGQHPPPSLSLSGSVDNACSVFFLPVPSHRFLRITLCFSVSPLNHFRIHLPFLFLPREPATFYEPWTRSSLSTQSVVFSCFFSSSPPSERPFSSQPPLHVLTFSRARKARGPVSLSSLSPPTWHLVFLFSTPLKIHLFNTLPTTWSAIGPLRPCAEIPPCEFPTSWQQPILCTAPSSQPDWQSNLLFPPQPGLLQT